MYFEPDEKVRLELGKTCILLGAGRVHLFLQNRRGELYAGFVDTTDNDELEAQIRETETYFVPDEAMATLVPIDTFARSCEVDDPMELYGSTRERIELEQLN